MIKESNVKNFQKDEIQNMIYECAKDGHYKDVEDQDNYFNRIKDLCIAYTVNNKSPGMDLLNVDQITKAINFIDNKAIELLNIKKKLNLKAYSWQMTEIKQTMDEYILSGDLKNVGNEIIGAKLSKDLTVTLELIKFCYVILQNIRKDLERKP